MIHTSSLALPLTQTQAGKSYRPELRRHVAISEDIYLQPALDEPGDTITLVVRFRSEPSRNSDWRSPTRLHSVAKRCLFDRGIPQIWLDLTWFLLGV